MIYEHLPMAFRERLGEHFLTRLVERQRREANLREERMILRGGEVIPYATGGAGIETIVLLHGFTGDRFNWYRFARELVGCYRLVIPDLPPFGEAEPKTSPSSVAAQSAILSDFLAKLSIERAHLVGNSMGGHLATWFALAHPSRVLSLGLLCPAGVEMPEPSAAARFITSGGNSFAVRTRADLDRVNGFLFGRIPKGMDLVADGIVRRERARAARVDAWLAEYRETASDLGARLADVDVPTLVLWGAKDGIIDRSCLPLFQRIPRSTGILLEHVGHLPMIEAPTLTARHYLPFVRRHGERTSARIA